MKKGLNVIQINGIRGLCFAGFVICCLAEGFIVFPGWSCMHIWNFAAQFINQLPVIGIIQGILLWGILFVSYYTFRKEKLIVCMKTPNGLTEDELKAVFENVQKQAKNDILLQNMIKARETELKIKNLDQTTIPKTVVSDDSKEEIKLK